MLNKETFYELQLTMVFKNRSQSTFPGDESGWEEGAPIFDNLRAVDENGSPIDGGYANIIGLNKSINKISFPEIELNSGNAKATIPIAIIRAKRDMKTDSPKNW